MGTGEHFRWLRGVVVCVLLLNLADAVFTILWVHAGLAREANTLMDELVSEHEVLFVVVKLGLVSLGSWLLWHWRDRPAAVVGLFLAFLVYYGLLLWHVAYGSLLLGTWLWP